MEIPLSPAAVEARAQRGGRIHLAVAALEGEGVQVSSSEADVGPKLSLEGC